MVIVVVAVESIRIQERVKNGRIPESPERIVTVRIESVRTN